MQRLLNQVKRSNPSNIKMDIERVVDIHHKVTFVYLATIIIPRFTLDNLLTHADHVKILKKSITMTLGVPH